jgi:hypothetical protein
LSLEPIDPRVSHLEREFQKVIIKRDNNAHNDNTNSSIDDHLHNPLTLSKAENEIKQYFDEINVNERRQKKDNRDELRVIDNELCEIFY